MRVVPELRAESTRFGLARTCREKRVRLSLLCALVFIRILLQNVESLTDSFADISARSGDAIGSKNGACLHISVS
jgi:hypothetical protein